eukprot:NODE_1302_length_2021_cov_146.669125_g1101_i0.p1 GENE.NODE_1302_length_2021_cov_146.669125_g1101_i0~~NODE_1302_length_2021_cov_146.669125_g1101_i0.p1  ORF type:complete len:601 (+),score=116.74 NODE_1302_length_2021_cov_146.669125_g1101_i0:66-1868(+)
MYQVGYPTAAIPPPAPYVEPYEREAEPIELSTPVDEDSWRYSRFALPWLLFCWAVLMGLLGLTFWQQAGNIKYQLNGVARLIELRDVKRDPDEAGQPRSVRGLRMGATIVGAVAVVGAFLVLFARPKLQIRNALLYFFCLLLLVSCVVAWVAFAISIANYKKQAICPTFRRFTTASCIQHKAWAITNSALDAGVGTFALFSFFLLLMVAIGNHWKLEPRDWEEAVADTQERPKERPPGERAQKNVGYVKRTITGLCLLALLGVIAADTVFYILLHEDREVEPLLGPRGRAAASRNYDDPVAYEHAGWPTKNTRIRYSATAIGLLAIMFNFLPFRSKTIAVVFALIYFGVAVMCVIAAAFDIHGIRLANDLNSSCDRTWDGQASECHSGSFIATVVLDLIAFFVLIIYIIVEYFAMQQRQCQHCTRAYGMNELEKHEASECGARPVRCEVCAKSMNYYQFQMHKRHCSTDRVRCKNCGIMVAKWGVKTHQDQCPRWPVPCNMCNESCLRSDLPHHVVVCPNRPSSCDACGETFRTKDLDAHRAVCGEVLVRCEMCDDQMPRFRTQQHHEYDCPKQLLQCDDCGATVPRFRWERHQLRECTH